MVNTKYKCESKKQYTKTVLRSPGCGGNSNSMMHTVSGNILCFSRQPGTDPSISKTHSGPGKMNTLNDYIHLGGEVKTEIKV